MARKNMLFYGLALVFVPLLTLGGFSSSPPQRDFGVDASTASLQVVDYEHHEIHSGSHFYYEDYDVINSGVTNVFAVQTADTAKWTHIVWEIVAQGQITFEVFEEATVTWDGTDLTAYNNNRNSSNTNNWVNFEEDPTVVSNGTKIASALIGDTSNPVNGIPGGGQRNREIILKQNTTYLFCVISGLNGNTVSSLAEWYNHQDKN